MLLNCTRLTHGCTTRRVTQISQIRSPTSYNHHLGRCLHRRSTARTTLPPSHPPLATPTSPLPRQLLQTLRMPWWCMRRGFAQSSKWLARNAKADAVPPVGAAPVKMARSQYGRLLSLTKSEKWVLSGCYYPHIFRVFSNSKSISVFPSGHWLSGGLLGHHNVGAPIPGQGHRCGLQ